MNSKHLIELASEIDNALEMTSVCRNEWCRALETEIDHLEDELHAINPVELRMNPELVGGLANKLNLAYRNLGPTIRI